MKFLISLVATLAALALFSSNVEAALPYTFATQGGGNVPASYLDSNYNAVDFMAVTQSTATGTNTIALATNSNQTAVSAYVNYQLFGFVAAATTSNAVTVNVNTIGALNLYLGDGATQANAGNLISGAYYTIVYNSALNSAAGGFQLVGSNSSSQAPLYPENFTAKCDGSTDDSTPLQNWLNAGAAGTPLALSGESCLFKTALSLTNPNNLSITGSGQTSSLLVYGGASTTADMITLGTTSGSNTTGILLDNFGIVSNTVMTGGTALHLKKVTYSNINVAVGTPSNTKAYNGIWQDTGSFLNTNNSQIYASNDAIRANNGVELRLGHTIIQGANTGNGIHIGGGFGGIYTEFSDEIYFNIGILIDTSLTSAGNTQVFIGEDSVFDSNVSAGCYFNDSYATSKAAFVNGWFATTGSGGNACVVVNWNGGLFFSSIGKFYNSQGSGNGLVLEDASVNYTFGTAALIANNGGVGIAATAPLTINSTATPFGNSSGSYSGTITHKPALGVNCSGSPTSGFIAVAGIVTHC